MDANQLKIYLDQCVEQFNRPTFIEDDPISIPHQFDQLQDIEIMGFWVSMLAWGQRKTIINKANELIALMDGAPHDFIVNHEERDRARFASFKHRTFQYTDTLYFLHFFQTYYRQYDSLEQAFSKYLNAQAPHIGPALIGFHNDFFALEDAPQRTRKHIATPTRKSSCKRLNMFLRWMVRKDGERGGFRTLEHDPSPTITHAARCTCRSSSSPFWFIGAETARLACRAGTHR